MNYGGSTGFGRAYRARLEGNWGVVDVEDAVNTVAYLAAQGEIDGARAAIRGSSAGGYTTLAAMTFHHAFKVGVSLYGIGDLGLLAADTHKFESRYLDRLVAPWPEGKAIYEARSPLSHIDQLQGALLILQGAEDKVVPPNQAESMYQAAKQKGLPVSYILFPGEQHGFRKAETMRAALSAELFFYGKLFGFEPADRIAPIPIDNF
jgi:dipeptidyl aminopeptidase/acylaminoacyl peptidase